MAFSRVRRLLAVYVGLLALAVICLSWSVIALPAYFLMPARCGARFGRRGVWCSFRLFVGVLRALGAYRLELSAIATLSEESRLIIAPNHPQLIDALILLAYHPNMVCVMKDALMKNIFLGAGARLAGFVRHKPPRRMINESIDALQAGAVLLLFPEGTRSVHNPINDLQLTAGAIAKHAQVPIQTLLIETDSPYLSKGWSLFRVPALPITYRVRLGRRFPPPKDIRQFTQELHEYFATELADAPQRQWLARGTMP